MPRIRELVSRVEEYERSLKARNLEALILTLEEGLLLFYDQKKNATAFQELRERIKQLSKRFHESQDESLSEESRSLKDELKRVEDEGRELGERLLKLETVLPNWMDPAVPEGAGEENEKELRHAGKPKVWRRHAEEFARLYPGIEHDTTDEPPFHHYDLVGTLIDQEKGGEVAQTRFCYQLDELVILDLALSIYALEFFRERGYADKLMIPPYIMRRGVEEKATYFEAFEDTIFEIERDGLILIPSSEHPIISYYADTIFDEADLPLRITAWSPCFRREAGAHGKDTRGIFRVKQFHKTEFHCIVREGEDLAELDRNCADVEDFMASLGIPCRSVVVPAQDMDKRALKQIDVQAWMPGQGRYRETHSLATIDTWASEKLAIRYRAEGKKNVFARNIYGTAVAVQRMICVVAENCFDSEAGAIFIPQALRKYTMGLDRINVK